jgi:hypothetical protein
MFRPVVSPIAVPRPAASCSPPALRPHLSRAAPVQTKVGCRIWAFLLVAACTRRVALSFERKIDSAELHFHSDRATEFRKLTVQLRCRIENRRHICCPWANVEKVAKKWNYNRLVRAMFVSPAGWMVDKRRSASLISAGVKDELMLFRIRFTLISF